MTSRSHLKVPTWHAAALKKFVDEQMEDGDLVAIIRTGAGIGALQQFTSDKRLLYAAIEKVNWNPQGNGGISAFAPLDATDATDPDEPEAEPGERTAEAIEREFNDFRESYFAVGTLGALEYVIRGMSELPGRKSVILFSDGFPMFNTNAQGFIEDSAALDPMVRTHRPGEPFLGGRLRDRPAGLFTQA